MITNFIEFRDYGVVELNDEEYYDFIANAPANHFMSENWRQRPSIQFRNHNRISLPKNWTLGHPR